MKPSSDGSKSSLIETIFRIFKKPKTPLQSSAASPDNSIEPLRIVTVRVQMVVYDPVMDPVTGIKLSQLMKWQSPDDLANAFIKDILETSDGKARYQITQRVELNEFPAKTDGYRYDAQTFLNVQKGLQPPHQPELADYEAMLTKLKVLQRIATRDIDEIWIFAFPHAGFFESTMGGAGAFWCNSQPMTWSSGGNRRFIVMGFSFERGVGEMLESFGHRAESLVAKVYNCQDFVAWAYKQNRTPTTVGATLNPFQKFMSFDQIAPGKANIGSIHYAPNSSRDYEWNNLRYALSNCYDWYHFPKFQNDIRLVNASEWGNGDIRAHHKWWLNHLPKTAGRTGGVANNWWQYIMDPNLISV